MNYQFLAVVVSLFSVVAIVPSSVYAFGGKRPEPKEPTGTFAYPTRVIAIGKFVDGGFMLPDGKTRVDSAILLPEIVQTQIGRATRKFRTSGPATPEDRFTLHGGITAFEANISEFGIRFGFNKDSGDLWNGRIVDANAEVRVKIGRLEMDFRIYDTVRRENVAFGHADSHTSDVKAEIKVNFKKFDTGADFIYRSPLAPIIRTIVEDAIKEMADNPETNRLMDWKSLVTSVDLSAQVLIFGAGTRDEIQNNNLFNIYDNLNKLIGTVMVSRAEHEQSLARFKEDGSGKLLRSVNTGDQVKIDYSAPVNDDE